MKKIKHKYRSKEYLKARKMFIEKFCIDLDNVCIDHKWLLKHIKKYDNGHLPEQFITIEVGKSKMTLKFQNNNHNKLPIKDFFKANR